MRRISVWVCTLLLLQVLAAGCAKKDKFEPSIYDVESEPLNEVGTWIHDNYVVPYNIDVIYRWRDNESNIALNLTPPRQDEVVDFLKMMHTTWITVYLELCGKAVMKPIFPKQIQLIGSAGYYSTGGIVQGTAEQGKKLMLYDLDNYDPGTRDKIWEYTRIMHHEFGHLLNQRKEYPLAFKRITPDSYTSSWNNVTDSQANDLGFVTPYATSEPDEDFVETLAMYVTKTTEEWSELLTTKGQLKIERKLDVVRTYMQENYNVDIDVLRSLVLQRIDDVVAGNYK